MEISDRMQVPSVFQLELRSDNATRNQIVDRLKRIIAHIESLTRGVSSSGLFTELWTCHVPSDREFATKTEPTTAGNTTKTSK